MIFRNLVIELTKEIKHSELSARIYYYVIHALLLILLSITGIELIFNLESTSLELLIPFALLFGLLVICYHVGKRSPFFAHATVVLSYVLIELHLLVSPHSYHVLNYWFCIIPIIAIIVVGVRPALLWLTVVLASIILNGIFVKLSAGDLYAVVVQVNPFMATGLIFSITMFSGVFLLYKLLADSYHQVLDKSNDLELLKNSIESQREKLERYLESVFILSRDNAVQRGNFLSLYEKICDTAASTLNINRVSIWMHQRSDNILKRVHLYMLAGDSDSIDTFQQKEFPAYFNSIQSKRFVGAEHAQLHPDTAALLDSYLNPLAIQSKLDCPIIINGRFAGILCCETQGYKRAWSAEDILYSQSLTDLISMGHKSNQLKSFLYQIRSQNQELRQQQNEIAEMNHELRSLNELLEWRVKERTSRLEEQNSQLTEYAFINSHVLRAPLSRILGLSYILTKADKNEVDLELFKNLTKSCEELDGIIRTINDLLQSGTDFNRELLKEIIDQNLQTEN